MDGQYQELQPNPDGRLWSQQLQLCLGINESKLRFFTVEGQLLSTPEEAVEREWQRAERLAEKLREMGIDPSEF